MNFKLIQYRENIYAGFWVIPLILTIAIILLFFICLLGDHYLLKFFPDKSILHLEKQSIISIFSIIATATVSIISVTFSITVLTLSIASNQLGQRLLPQFMKQKQTQIILGCYAGTFIYALLIILSFSIKISFVTPSFASVKVGIVLGILCIFILIYFIHFVCHAIQIDNILLLLSNEAKKSINRQFKSNYKNAVIGDDKKFFEVQKMSGLETKMVPTFKAGYIQAIDYDSLLQEAQKLNLILKIHVNPGEFVCDKMALLTIYFKNKNKTPKNITSIFQEAFHIGIRRTTTHDAGFGFEQISEIALRALSPGINAPYTAVHCLDRIFDGFTALIGKKPLPRLLKDDEQNIRIITSGYDFKSLVDDSLNKIRQNSTNDILVSIYILKMIHKSLYLDYSNTMKAALYNQAELIYKDLKTKDINSKDAVDIDNYFKQLNKTYKQKQQ